MKVLKEGNIDPVWVGKCRDCYSILTCYLSDLEASDREFIRRDEENPDNDFSYGDCLYCGRRGTVKFYKLRCTESKLLLRNYGINPLTLE